MTYFTAYETGRMLDNLGRITPETVNAASVEELQSCGITFKKAGYIKGFAAKVASGEFDIDAVEHMSDAEAIAALSSLDGIGIWTAEMLLLFNPGVKSTGELLDDQGREALHGGLFGHPGLHAQGLGGRTRLLADAGGLNRRQVDIRVGLGERANP